MENRIEKTWHNTVCLDFDGVIAEFGNEKAGQPVPGMRSGIKRLLDAGWYIEVYSGRSNTRQGRAQMKRWFLVFCPHLTIHIEKKLIHFASSKPTAKVYIDDRAMKMDKWEDVTPERLEQFRAWWQHPDSTK